MWTIQLDSRVVQHEHLGITKDWHSPHLHHWVCSLSANWELYRNICRKLWIAFCGKCRLKNYSNDFAKDWTSTKKWRFTCIRDHHKRCDLGNCLNWHSWGNSRNLLACTRVLWQFYRFFTCNTKDRHSHHLCNWVCSLRVNLELNCDFCWKQRIAICGKCRIKNHSANFVNYWTSTKK